MSTVDIPPELQASLHNFRFAKRSQGSAALVLKVNITELIIEKDAEFDNISIEELAEELPGTKPRFVVLSYELKHSDGRISFPLVLINWAPEIASTRLLTCHTTAIHPLQTIASISKIIHIHEGSEGFTKELVDQELGNGN